MTARGIPDVVGMTEAGRPIITSTGCCGHFERQNGALTSARECWYCKYADFRENTEQQTHYGICRLKRSKPSPKLSDDELDAAVGGIGESGQAIPAGGGYQCKCGAVFYCPIPECPVCHNTEIRKIT